MAIDAFRTIFEGIYFGIRHTAMAGFLPQPVFKLLSQPEYVFMPKFVTFITGVLVLMIVLYSWMPAELKQKRRSENLLMSKFNLNELLTELYFIHQIKADEQQIELRIAKENAELIGGHTSLESEKGKGTTNTL